MPTPARENGKAPDKARSSLPFTNYLKMNIAVHCPNCRGLERDGVVVVAELEDLRQALHAHAQDPLAIGAEPGDSRSCNTA